MRVYTSAVGTFGPATPLKHTHYFHFHQVQIGHIIGRGYLHQLHLPLTDGARQIYKRNLSGNRISGVESNAGFRLHNIFVGHDSHCARF